MGSCCLFLVMLGHTLEHGNVPRNVVPEYGNMPWNMA